MTRRGPWEAAAGSAGVVKDYRQSVPKSAKT